MSAEFVKKSTKTPGPLIRILDTIDRLILRGWRVFVSLRFGIFMLALIGIVSIWGTMNYASNAALGDNAIPMARVHVFEHPYFVGLLVLFSVNLILSTWHVTRMSFGIWWKREFKRTPLFYEHGTSPRGALKPEGGLDGAMGTLRRRFTRVHRDGDAIYAQRGIASRLGPTIVHIGMLTVIGSIVVKAALLWNGSVITEGRFVAAEGEALTYILQPISLDQQITPENSRITPIDSWVRVLDFDEIKHPNSNVPAHFTSLIEVRDPATQEITVAQLDMNHSLTIRTKAFGDLQFHQAGYQAVPDGDVQRVNYDVRDRGTGERIAVTDASPGTRVRVGETKYFLEVDGAAPASRWRLYTASAPLEPVATGLVTGGRQLNFAFKPLEFYTDFRINETTRQPFNASPDLTNPALRVGILLDGRQVQETWLFFNQELAAIAPDPHPRFRLELSDVRAPRNAELSTIAWNEPGSVLYQVTVHDKQTGASLPELLAIGQASGDRVYTATVDHSIAAADNEGGFEVRLLGPTQRYLTVLSVVNEPTVFWTKVGVAIILIGAMMTFLSRYRSFYGLWDEEAGVLRLALVPRWGVSPVREEFDALVKELSGGRGLVAASLPGDDESVADDEVRRPSYVEV